MGLMDRIKKVTGANDTYDDTYDDDYYGVYGDNYDGAQEEGDAQFGPQPQPGVNVNPGPAPAVNVNVNPGPGMNPGSQPVGGPAGGGAISLSGSNIKMQVVRPETYDSDTATQIANHLLNRCTVVLNLEKTSKEASRRLIDFLTGVAYSIGGDLRNIATNAYVITPSNVDVENAKIRPTSKPAPEPEPEETTDTGDFSDFN